MTNQASRQDLEDLETLVGKRSRGNKKQRAVRLDDIAPLLELPPMTATEAAAAPTQAEFNALFDDYKALYNLLTDIAGRLKGKL